MENPILPEQDGLKDELDELLRQVQSWAETPMIMLAFAWIALLIVEFIWGISPFLSVMFNAIWVIFILDFLLRFAIAPRKLAYLKSNWLTAISLALPALRVLRVIRAVRLLMMARTARGGLRLVRVISSTNRGMRALRATASRRGFGYVTGMTGIVLLLGAAGMWAFEGSLPGDTGFEEFGDALWWTAMILTTLGSEYWPQTAEGRVLAVLLSAYSLAILGYVTAALASFFIGRDAEDESAEVAGATSIRALEAQIEALQADVRRLIQATETRQR